MERLSTVRSRHAGILTVGHLWWTWWQVRGMVAANRPAPACTPEAGLDQSSLENIPLAVLMKKW